MNWRGLLLVVEALESRVLALEVTLRELIHRLHWGILCKLRRNKVGRDTNIGILHLRSSLRMHHLLLLRMLGRRWLSILGIVDDLLRETSQLLLTHDRLVLNCLVNVQLGVRELLTLELGL